MRNRDPLTAVDLARVGADTGLSIGRMDGEECLPAWAVTVLGALIVLSAVIQSRACWRPPPGSPPGLNQKWEDTRSTGLLPHQAPRPALVLRLEVAGTGLSPQLLEDLICHPAFLGLRAGLDTGSQGCTGDVPT